MINVIIDREILNKGEIEYIIEILYNLIKPKEKDYNDFILFYGRGHGEQLEKNKKIILIWASDFFYGDYMSKNLLPSSYFCRTPLFSLFGKEGCPPVEQKDNILRLNIDIIATSFIFLTCYEEVFTSKKDAHGRFDLKDCLSERFGLKFRPFIHEYCDLLRKFLGIDNIKSIGRIPVSFGIDFDHFSGGFLYPDFKKKIGKLRDEFSGKHYLQTLKFLIQFLKITNDKSRIDVLFKSFFAKNAATLNIIVRDNPEKDSRKYYKIEDLPNGILKDIPDNIEISLHGSYDSLDHPEYLKEEAQLILKTFGAFPAGARQHYLRWNIGMWRHYEDIGLKYSSNLACHSGVGLRNGMVLPYRPFDIYKRKKHTVIELPIFFSDQTIKGKTDRNIFEEWKAELDTLYNAVLRNTGYINILWHNTMFSQLINLYGLEAYEYISSLNLEFLTCNELSEKYCIN